MRAVRCNIARRVEADTAQFLGILELLFQLGLADRIVAEEIDLVDADLGTPVDQEGEDLGILHRRVTGFGRAYPGVLVALIGIVFFDGLDSGAFHVLRYYTTLDQTRL